MKTTRREFIEISGKAAAGITLLGITPACESFAVDGSYSESDLRFITKADEWFWYSFRDFAPRYSPTIDAEEWSLDVRSGGKSVGEVAYRKLRALEDDGFAVSYLKTMRCIRGAYAKSIPETLTATAVFRGIPLGKVLEDTSISGEAAKLRFEAYDGFKSSILFSRLADETMQPVILAFEMNGRPIPPERGGPVRLIVPEMWAFKSMKWITAVDATTDASSFGSFETGDYAGQTAIDTPGLMALMALSQNPGATRVEVQGPTIEMRGMALVGGARITAVEVVVDNGEPELATIAPIETILDSLGHDALLVQSTDQYRLGNDWPYANVWAPWTHTITVTPGPHVVVIRAVDSNGQSNPSITADSAIIAQHVAIDLDVT